MADPNLRDLERRAAAGDVSAAKKLAVALVRTGIFSKAVETVLLVGTHLHQTPTVRKALQTITSFPHVVYEVWIDHMGDNVDRFSSPESAARRAVDLMDDAIRVLADDDPNDLNWVARFRVLAEEKRLDDAMGLYNQHARGTWPRIEIYEETVS